MLSVISFVPLYYVIIYVRRKGLLYAHHGIYGGDGIVIHFKGVVREKKDPVVIKTDIENLITLAVTGTVMLKMIAKKKVG